MKLKTLTLPIAVILLLLSFLTSNGQSREFITLQTGWKFAKGNFDKAAQLKFDDSKWSLLPYSGSEQQ